tara:strand:+ start:230 stop:775 length:546 start_codon:yes stop_codon:yes gene_type:complete
MKIKSAAIKDVLIITPEIYEDSRGYFYESFNKKKFQSFSGNTFNSIQDNQSYSEYGTLRGIHFQSNPMSQAKLVRVIEGEIFDVAVDLRESSPTYCHWVGEKLSSENHNQLYIPEGFGHAFLVLSKKATIIYKVNNYYSPHHERSIRYDDPKLNIQWPDIKFKLSHKDANAPFIDDQSSYF